MKKTIELLPPLMPNYIHYKLDGSEDLEGKSSNLISVKSLSGNEAREYADMIKDAFMKHWAKTQEDTEKPISRAKAWDGISKEDR